MLLPFLDAEVSHALAGAMAGAGIEFHWNQHVAACREDGPDRIA